MMNIISVFGRFLMLLSLLFMLPLACSSVPTPASAAQPTSTEVVGQTAPVLYVCVGNRPPHGPTTASNGAPSENQVSPSRAGGASHAASLPALASCDSYPDGTAAETQTLREYADVVTASPSRYLIIRMTDNSNLVSDIWSKISKVVVRGGAVEFEKVNPGSIVDDKILVELSRLSALPNGTVIAVEVQYQSSEHRPTSTSYFTLINRASPYGVANTGAYVWFPVGLFASNFRSTADGIPFAAFPVGIALGARFSPGSWSGYLGVSAMANWVINPAAPSSGSSGSSVVNLGGGSLGLLLDVSNIFYVGAAYVFDFRSEVSNPGVVGVVGVGPGLLQALQAARHQ